MVTLKKHLGQHLLKDHAAVRDIVTALDITKDDLLVEIGPGTGNLTTELVNLPAKLIVLEKDQDMIESLNERFPTELSSKQMEIISGSALDFNPSDLHTYIVPLTPNPSPKLGRGGLPLPLGEGRGEGLTYKLAGNIPYNITGALFEHFLSAKLQPERLVFLIQKEVADRIMARDGKHSILSLSIHIYGTPKMIRKVPAGAFNPPPKVDSAIIAINGISRANFIDSDHEDLFFQIIKTGFAHPRKFALSNLAAIFTRTTLEAVWSELGINPKIRPEDMTLSEWISIGKSLYTDAYGNAQ
jgi:16S rRNA (adenine1518-N6/adenine1519-N6)-dimethyltransferase